MYRVAGSRSILALIAAAWLVEVVILVMLITEGSLAGGHCTEFVQGMFDDLVAGPGNANLPIGVFQTARPARWRGDWRSQAGNSSAFQDTGPASRLYTVALKKL